MNELRLIKKYYGEDFSHFIRDSFPGLLEQDSLVLNLLETHFEHNKELYNDIVHFELELQFKEFIYSLMEEKEELVVTKFTPFELMDKAGYKLYECKTEEDIQKFKKYYAYNEYLCTFHDNRLKKCLVFFAVKKDVDKIKREDFSNPKRQDKYGTSVMSIQFWRGKVNTLSIKNRYNHHVEHPDSTYGNNLERINPGLTYSFQKHYNLNINSYATKLELLKHNYIMTSEGKFIHYNIENNDIYYCNNNIIVHRGKIIDKYKDKREFLLIDYFIINLKNHTIEKYDSENIDGFLDTITDIKRIDVLKKEYGKQIIISQSDGNSIIIKIDKFNNIIGYKNENITEINDLFLLCNETLEEIEIPNVRKIGDTFLAMNRNLKKIDLPFVIIIGNCFLSSNNILENANLPRVVEIGDLFLNANRNLKELYLPRVKTIGDLFLEYNNSLEILALPKVINIGEFCCNNNNSLKELYLPNVKSIKCSFFGHNNSLIDVYMPNLETIDFGAFEHNNSIKKIDISNIEKCGLYFMKNNSVLEECRTSEYFSAGSGFMTNNKFGESYKENVKRFAKLFS